MKRFKEDTNIGLELSRSAFRNSSTSLQITDASRLLESPEQKEKVEIMRSLSWDKSITRTETAIGREKERSELQESFGHNDVSKLGEIAEIAIDYGLWFGRAARFKCPEKHEHRLASMISDFILEKKVERNMDNFWVLADRIHFEKRLSDIDQEIGVFLFYSPPKDGDNYLRVDQMGRGNLTTKQYFKGWKMKSMENAIIYSSLLSFFCALPVAMLLTWSLGWSFAISVAAAIGITWMTVKNIQDKGGFNEHTWHQ